jgi:ethanolamine utilization protein EutP
MDAILMGASRAGKTTLIQALCGEPVCQTKTATVERRLGFIDTPGEYMERRSYYRALIVTAADADAIGLVADVGRDIDWIPPALATTFDKPVFGVVTKTDLAGGPADIDRARQVLQRAGAAPIFEVSALTGAGMAGLCAYLNAPAGAVRP